MMEVKRIFIVFFSCLFLLSFLLVDGRIIKTKREQQPNFNNKYTMQSPTSKNDEVETEGWLSPVENVLMSPYHAYEPVFKRIHDKSKALFHKKQQGLSTLNNDNKQSSSLLHTQKKQVDEEHSHQPKKDNNAITPDSSPNDERNYSIITVEGSGLMAILISDPNTPVAAASMSVHVGHLSDPDDVPGLAHFLEHMLFLGF